VDTSESTGASEHAKPLATEKLSRGGHQNSRNRHRRTPLNSVSRVDARLKLMLKGLSAAADGDFGVRLKRTADAGVMGQIARRFNEVMARNEAMAHEIMRVEHVVRRQGRMNERASLQDARGGWRDIADSIKISSAAWSSPPPRSRA
jgi:hypothetical protein